MIGAAKLNGARMSAQKARLVVDQIRGKPVGEALNILNFSTKKGAHLVRKLLESAIANAEHNEGADVDELSVATVYVDEGVSMKRIRPRVTDARVTGGSTPISSGRARNGLVRGSKRLTTVPSYSS